MLGKSRANSSEVYARLVDLLIELLKELLGPSRPVVANEKLPHIIELGLLDLAVCLDDRRGQGNQVEAEVKRAQHSAMINDLGLRRADRKSTRLNSSHPSRYRMPSSA